MQRFHVLCWGTLAGLGLLWCDAAQAQSVSFGSLLDEMIDRDNLARYPQPAYKCSQASSYDRGTVGVDQPGWYANMDRSWFVRTEKNAGRTEHVMMDEEGPGSVVRIWATWHGPGGGEFSNGTIRFYLDGNPEPAIEGPIASIIDSGGLVTGTLAEGVSPQTEYRRRGHNLYLPIPYAKHCKITYETSVFIDDGGREGEALYYQVNYRTYDKGTKVEPFEMKQVEQLKEKIADVQQRLVATGVAAGITKKISFSGPLAAGKTRTLVVDRPGAIRQLTIGLRAEDQPQVLRSTILQIECDGMRTVWCPVGAFFGRGYQSDPHKTWYTRVTDDGTMSCFWVMPYQKECKISLINLAEESVDVVQGEASVGPWQWDDRSMYFHGSWRQLTKVSSFREGTTRPGEGAYDVNYVEVDGKGVYVGDTLTIFNGALQAWWGEGDEKIFVDKETFPSHVGTGTEDYYGYAWCRPEYFESPFHAQPTGAGNLRAGFSVNSRYRALDAIPFTESIKFDMELWHWRKTTVNFAPAAFWYALPGSTSNVKPDPKTAAEPVALKRSDVVEIVRVKGVTEAEELKILERTGGIAELQSGAFEWSGEAQVWWKDGKPGDRLVFEFPVEKAGKYEVLVNLTKAIDYGIVKLAINDGEPKEYDRFNQGVAHNKESLGIVDLPQGANRLTVTIVGAHENAVKRYMFGLDYLQLVPKS